MKMPTFEKNPKEKAFSGFGKSMLKAMGWSEGEGLGKQRDGIKEHVKVKQREFNIGLGAEKERYKWEEKWWENHYEGAAAKIAAACADAGVAVDDGGSDGSDSDSDSDADSDSEMARNLKHCAVDATGKKIVAAGKVKGRDGIYYSGRESDLKLAKDLAKGGGKGDGGFFGRAKGKLARIAEAEKAFMDKYGGVQEGDAARERAARGDDASSSGGGSPDAKKAKTSRTKASKRDKKKAKAAANDEAEAAKKAAKKADKKSKKSAPRTPSPDPEPEPLTGEAYEGKPSASTLSLSWWQNAKFTWGGVVGSKRERDLDDRSAVKRERGFTEDDQEALFNLAHDGKVEKRSKRGLGGKGVIKTEHTGTKRRFDDDGELDAAPGTGKSAKEPAAVVVKEKREKKEKKEKKSKKEKSPKVDLARAPAKRAKRNSYLDKINDLAAVNRAGGARVPGK
jgi:hypothetical protein